MDLHGALDFYTNYESLITEAAKDSDGEVVPLVGVREMIQSRIENGLDSDMQEIGRYNLNYSGAFKNRREDFYTNWALDKREPKGLGISYVNFKYTGGLLDSIRIEMMPDYRVEFNFATDMDKAVSEELDALFGSRAFDFSDIELEAIAEAVSESAYTNALQKMYGI